jgi:branched-chain amino acid transport system permease protein
MDAQIFFENTLNACVSGLVIGCIYGLMCVGLSLIFGIMRVVNFAQGDLLMLGAYAAFYLVVVWGTMSVLGPAGPFVAALLAGPMVFCLGWLLHRFLLSSFYLHC